MVHSNNNIKLIDPKTHETIEIYPDMGGTIKTLTMGEDLHHILAGDRDEEFLQNPLFRGRILFPFNDRIPEGSYSFRGMEYQLPINNTEDNSAIHGFLYNKKVSILQQSKNSVSMFWRTGLKKYQGYPFDLSLKTDITIDRSMVTLSFTVKNEGNITAPFALGWHSYFKTDSTSKLFADYPFYYNIDENYLPVGNEITSTGTKFDFSNGDKFSNKILDHTFGAPAKGLSILTGKDYNIQIKQTNFAYTQLFIPPDKKSIAIEPISSKPNSFNSKEVLVLKPGEEYSAGININII